jgi:hypothetical protein
MNSRFQNCLREIIRNSRPGASLFSNLADSRGSCVGFYFLRSEKIAPSSPRETSIAPATPSITGANRSGTMGIARIENPTSESEIARVLDSYGRSPPSGWIPARTPQYTKNAPSAISAAGRAGSPTRPEIASRTSRAPSKKTMSSLSNRNGLIVVAIFVAWRNYAAERIRLQIGSKSPNTARMLSELSLQSAE